MIIIRAKKKKAHKIVESKATERNRFVIIIFGYFETFFIGTSVTC